MVAGLPAPLLNTWRAIPLLWWQRLLIALALFWLLYTLAKLSWQVYDASSWTPPAPAQSQAQFTPAQVDIEALVAAELFGSTEVVPVDTGPQEAPDSTASLKLLGVYAAENEQKASAILQENTGNQSVVFVGEALPGGYGTLKQVFADRVVIDRGGRLETLRMEDLTAQLGDLSGGAALDAGEPKTEARVIDKRRDAQVTQSLQEIRGKLQADPTSLTDVLSIEPAYDKGTKQLQGYRIGPGKDRKLFGRFGLQRNDLITAINGVTLDDPTRALSLINDLNDAKELTVTLQRGGQPLDIQLSLQNP